MIKVRFHGRGGHGVKTASRILGTAAFLEGYHVQDFPLYGAERRGAPIVAFTRIAGEPVLERGIIANPDVIIVADETLLNDPAAKPLQGMRSGGIVMVNTTMSVSQLWDHYHLAGQVVSLDLTEITMSIMGKTAALSTALGGVASKLVGFVKIKTLEEAVCQELRGINLSEGLLKQNLEVARESYMRTPSLPLREEKIKRSTKARTITLPYHDATIGTPSIYAEENAVLRKTGSWRVTKPVIDLEACTRCAICFVYCPDGAIVLDEESYPHIDYDHCKGCLICVEECPPQIISIEREVKAW